METLPKQIVVNCTGRVTAEEAATGILDALKAGLGEVKFVVTAPGGVHFTSWMLDDIYHVVRQAGGQISEAFDRTLSEAEARTGAEGQTTEGQTTEGSREQK